MADTEALQLEIGVLGSVRQAGSGTVDIEGEIIGVLWDSNGVVQSDPFQGALVLPAREDDGSIVYLLDDTVLLQEPAVITLRRVGPKARKGRGVYPGY